MDDDPLSNKAFSEASLLVVSMLVGGGIPDYEKKLAAALERERLDPVPRSDIEKILRRQGPVGLGDRDGGAALESGRAIPAGRWFKTRRGRIRVEAYIAGGSLLVLVGPATVAFYYLSERVSIVLSLTAALVTFLGFVAIFIELFFVPHDREEDEDEKAVARLVSGGS